MKFKIWHAIAIVSVAVLAAYYPSLSAPLNSVDDTRMANDLLNRSGFSWRDFIFPASRSYYRPLVISSFIADRFLWNLEAPFLHLENLVLHWANSLLVFALARQIARRMGLDQIYVPFFAALIFGLHPVNTEAVIWVAGRFDLMAGFFILLTLISTFLFFEKRTFYWAFFASATFFLGCTAKETVLFVWPCLVLVGYLAYKSPQHNGVNPSLKFLTAQTPALMCLPSICIYFLLRHISLSGRDLGLGHVKRIFTGTIMSNATTGEAASSSVSNFFDTAVWLLKVIGFYARKVVQPFPLNFGIVELHEMYFWGGIGVVFLSLYFLFRLSWTRFFFLAAVSLGSIALLVAFDGIAWTPVAERYLYAPTIMASIGFVLLGNSVFMKFPKKGKPFALTGFSLFFVVAFFGVYQRSLVWQDNVLLFEDTVAKAPEFVMAKNELAMALMKRGDHDRAMAIWRDLEIPAFQVASLNKASAWMADGDYRRAYDYLIDRLENPGSYRRVIMERLITVLKLMAAKAQDPLERNAYRGEMLHYLDELWKLTSNPFYLYRMGRLYLSMGNDEQAQQAFEKASELFPQDSIYKKPAQKLSEELQNP